MASCLSLCNVPAVVLKERRVGGDGIIRTFGTAVFARKTGAVVLVGGFLNDIVAAASPRRPGRARLAAATSSAGRVASPVFELVRTA